MPTSAPRRCASSVRLVKKGFCSDAARRSATVLRALADDPASGWTQTPVARRATEGFSIGPYVSAFLRHHEMPTTRAAMDLANGFRLWTAKKESVNAEARIVGRAARGQGRRVCSRRPVEKTWPRCIIVSTKSVQNPDICTKYVGSIGRL